MYKFVMWGLGVNGRRFLDICPSERVAAVIDSDPKLQGEEYKEIPIISYEEYMKKYGDYDILNSPIDDDAICAKLKENGVYNILHLTDCPSEILGFPGGIWVDKLPVEVSVGENVIYGLNLYAILLREYLAETKGLYLDIIPEEDDVISKAFADKYPYVVLRKPLADETVLWASGYPVAHISNRIVNVFDFTGKIKSLEIPALAKFKNAARKNRCFIIGNGPSLKMEDLNTLQRHGEDCFGTNGIYKAFTNTYWRPRYYVTQDRLAVSEGLAGMEDCSECTCFYGDYVEEINEKYKDDERMNKLHVHVLYLNGKKESRFSDDITEGVYEGSTVTYSCIQIAAYMGYKEIYLLGVDGRYVGDDAADPRNHFVPDYFSAGIKPNPDRPDWVEKSYKCAKFYADAHGINIYNATRGGVWEMFERTDFDSLFTE